MVQRYKSGKVPTRWTKAVVVVLTALIYLSPLEYLIVANSEEGMSRKGNAVT